MIMIAIKTRDDDLPQENGLIVCGETLMGGVVDGSPNRPRPSPG
jgi:hypothetical protein